MADPAVNLWFVKRLQKQEKCSANDQEAAIRARFAGTNDVKHDRLCAKMEWFSDRELFRDFIGLIWIGGSGKVSVVRA